MDKALPDTIRRVIEREIERLSLEEQRLLGVASAIGSHFSCVIARCGARYGRGRGGPLLRCVGQARPDIASRTAWSRVRKAKSSVIMLFRHALYVEVLYQRLSPGQLIRLHLRIGECLERLHGKKDLKYAAELALHFEKGWDWSRAVRYLTQAAANAARRFANRAGLRLSRSRAGHG